MSSATILQKIQRSLVDALFQIEAETALPQLVQDCNFSISIADPQLEDCPLIAVSDGFELVTGYSSSDVVGLNCRFLNQGCNLNDNDLRHLRKSSSTGEPFTALLLNRRSSGELFLNLLDMRGLIVGHDVLNGGKPIMYIVGIQADVTSLAINDAVPKESHEELGRVTTKIRQVLGEKLAVTCCALSRNAQNGRAQSVDLLHTPIWVNDSADHLSLTSSTAIKGDAPDANFRQNVVTENGISVCKFFANNFLWAGLLTAAVSLLVLRINRRT